MSWTEEEEGDGRLKVKDESSKEGVLRRGKEGRMVKRGG